MVCGVVFANFSCNLVAGILRRPERYEEFGFLNNFIARSMAAFV